MKVVGDSIYYCGYTDDSNDDRKVGIAARLSSEGDGMGTYGRWVYSEDTDAEFETSTSDAVVIDSGYTSPTDGVSQSISGNSVSVSTRNIGGEFETNEGFGNPGGSLYGLSSIRWADGTTQTTFHHRHGNYSFDENNFNIPNDAILEASNNNVRMNAGDYSLYSNSYYAETTNSYRMRAMSGNMEVTGANTDVNANDGNLTLNASNNANIYANNILAQASTNATLMGPSRVEIKTDDSVVIQTAIPVSYYQDNWIYDSTKTLYSPSARSSRMSHQGTTTTVKGDPVPAIGTDSAMSNAIFYIATSAKVHTVKLVISYTLNGGTYFTPAIGEFVAMRRYDGATRQDDTTSSVLVSFNALPTQTSPQLITSISATGLLQCRLQLNASGDIGALTYHAIEFEAAPGRTPT
jgi:phage baseplate assembly protein gpV